VRAPVRPHVGANQAARGAHHPGLKGEQQGVVWKKVAAILAAAAGGSLSDIETTVAMTAKKDAHATFQSKAAKDFRSAGR
jgi:hypothetical protein